MNKKREEAHDFGIISSSTLKDADSPD